MNAEKRTHFEWLDMLRFVAALMVVVTHVRSTLFVEYGALSPESQNPLVAIFFASTRLGHEAVVVFLVLSGYLVGGKAIDRIVKSTFRPTEYAIDRISRIWLPLVPALVLSAALGSAPNSASVWLGNLLGLQGVVVPMLGGNGPLWSLAYEIWFYVLAYAVGRQSLAPSLDWMSVLLLVLVTSVFTVLQVQYLACWIIGALCYVRPSRLSPRLNLSAGLITAFVAIAALQLTDDGFMAVAQTPATSRAVLEVLLAVGAGLMCVAFAKMPSSNMSAKTVSLAAFSYTLYLTHYPLLLAVGRARGVRMISLDVRAFMLFGIVTAACVFSAWILYLPFERNTPQFRRWLKRRLGGAPGIVDIAAPAM